MDNRSDHLSPLVYRTFARRQVTIQEREAGLIDLKPQGTRAFVFCYAAHSYLDLASVELLNTTQGPLFGEEPNEVTGHILPLVVLILFTLVKYAPELVYMV